MKVNGFGLWGKCVFLGLCFTALSGCAGKPSVKEQYAKRARDIREKYDAMIVPNGARLAADEGGSCEDMIEKMKARYSYWRVGDAGEHFCASNPKLARRRAFETRIRNLHNKAVARGKAKRLSHLAMLAREALRGESTVEKNANRAPASGARGVAGRKARTTSPLGQEFAQENSVTPSAEITTPMPENKQSHSAASVSPSQVGRFSEDAGEATGSLPPSGPVTEYE